MSITFAEARAALVAAVESVGLACTGYIQDSKNPPCAEVTAEPFDPRMVFGTKATYLFKIRIFDQRGEPASSIARLDAWCQPGGEASVIDAVRDENNWDGWDLDYVDVTEVSGDGVIEITGVQYLVRELDIEVVF